MYLSHWNRAIKRKLIDLKTMSFRGIEVLGGFEPP